MNSIQSNFIFISPVHPEVESLAQDLGGVILAPDAALATSAVSAEPLAQSPAVIVIPLELIRSEDLKRLQIPDRSEVLLVGSPADNDFDGVLDFTSRWPVSSWLKSFDDPELLPDAVAALEKVRARRQLAESIALYLKNNEELQRLSTELETRIEARKRELAESSARLVQSQHKAELLRKALSAIHLSPTLIDIERGLGRVLSSASPTDSTGGTEPQSATESVPSPFVEWVQIRFGSQGTIAQAALKSRLESIYSVQMGQMGTIYFGRAKDRPFRAEDRTLLAPIAEAVSIALLRLRSLERLDRTRREWQQTFDAIDDRLVLLDENLELIRGNRAFDRSVADQEFIAPGAAKQRVCYAALFNRSEPCKGCQRFSSDRSADLETPFRIEVNIKGDEYVFEVSSRRIAGSGFHFMHLYRDVTALVRLEKRALDSSKMAELGTIGSSIAHQLNNPLAGMLSHIQLLLMDLEEMRFDGIEELRAELKEMESGARRCAQIVRELLGFSRKSADDGIEILDLNDVIDQAVKITELETRSRGIRFVGPVYSETSPRAPLVEGQFNLLAQAIRTLALALVHGDERNFSIELRLTSTASDELIFEMARVRAEPQRRSRIDSKVQGVDLVVAQDILSEMGASLELEVEEPGDLLVKSRIRFGLVVRPKDQF